MDQLEHTALEINKKQTAKVESSNVGFKVSSKYGETASNVKDEKESLKRGSS